MADIYDQHKAAFPLVSAFIVAEDGERVATVAIKFPRDGSGRLYAYVHWLGLPMVRGWAGGGGYDKRTAAVIAAGSRLADMPDSVVYQHPVSATQDITRIAFIAACRIDDGNDWTRNLEKAGFTVWQAV